VVLHGLGGSKDQMAPVATVLAAHGYAALAYSARGQGTSTGDLELAGPNEISDERAIESFLAGLPEVSNADIGAWGISYGGGQAGHTPSTFPGPDFAFVLTQGLAWYDHYLRGQPNGIDKAPPVTIAAATGPRRASYPAVPKTKVITVGFRGTSLRRTGPVFR